MPVVLDINSQIAALFVVAAKQVVPDASNLAIGNWSAQASGTWPLILLNLAMAIGQGVEKKSA